MKSEKSIPDIAKARKIKLITNPEKKIIKNNIGLLAAREFTIVA